MLGLFPVSNSDERIMINARPHLKHRVENFNVHRQRNDPKESNVSSPPGDTSAAAANKDNPIIGGREVKSLLRLATWDTVSENN